MRDLIVPLIKKIDIMGLKPFQSNTNSVSFYPVSLFIKENGGGKTTLFDCIKISLLRLEEGNIRYKRISEKRYTKTKETPYVLAEWVIKDKHLSFKHELFEDKIQSYLQNRDGPDFISQEEYQSKLQSLTDSVLDNRNFFDLFEYIVFMNEDQKEKLYPNLINFAENILPNIFLSYNAYEEIRQISEARRKADTCEKEKREIERNLKEKEELITILQNNNLENIKRKNEEYESINEEIKEISSRLEKKGALQSEILEKITTYEQIITLLSQNVEARKLVLQITANINDINDNLEAQKKIATVFLKNELNEAKVIRNRYDERQMCELCKSYNIKRNWEGNIRNRLCPVCKTSFEVIDGTKIKELFYTINDTAGAKELLSSDGKITQLKKVQEKLERQIVDNIDQIKRKDISILCDTDCSTDKLIVLIDEVKTKKLQKDVEKERCMKDVANLEEKLNFKKQLLSEIQKFIDLLEKQQYNIEKIDELKTALKKVISEKERIEKYSLHLQERKELLSKENERHKAAIISFIQNNRLLGDSNPFKFDFKEQKIILNNGESRSFESLSSGEKIFIEFYCRVLIWLYVFENGYESKGLMVLDDVDHIMDSKYKPLMKDIIIKTAKNIQYIITTRDRAWLEGQFKEIELHVSQKNLFDFLLH